jgi:hypothetical protein
VSEYLYMSFMNASVSMVCMYVSVWERVCVIKLYISF